MKPLYILLSFSFITISCNDNYQTKYPYSLEDFRPVIRKQLEKALSQELYGNDTTASFLELHATPNELEKITRCEHPLLRYKALRAIEDRKDMDRFSIIMNHLDDTAWVVIDAGEFGTWPRRVSDHMLLFARWETQSLKDKTVDEVILYHNYLAEAYRILNHVEPVDRYYKAVRRMASRYSPQFSDELIHALFALARYRKKEDISLIGHMLDTNIYHLDSKSFELMRQYPDSSYLPVLVKYGNNNLVATIRHEGINAPTKEYFDCIASYKTKTAADMYDVILRKLHRLHCNGDTAAIILSLHEAYWKNKCGAYKMILNRIEPFIRAREKQEAIWRKEYGELEPMEFQVTSYADSTSKEVGWP